MSWRQVKNSKVLETGPEISFGRQRLIATGRPGGYGNFTIDFQDFDFDGLLSPDEIFGFSGVTIGPNVFHTVRVVPFKIAATDGDGLNWTFAGDNFSGGSHLVSNWTYSVETRSGLIYSKEDPQQGYVPPDPEPILPGDEPPPTATPLPPTILLLAGPLGLLCARKIWRDSKRA